MVRLSATVAVSPDLAPFAAALRRHGFDVVDVPETDGPPFPSAVRARVVTGASRGRLGDWSTDRPIPVVQALGKTPEEVAAEVREALRGIEA